MSGMYAGVESGISGIAAAADEAPGLLFSWRRVAVYAAAFAVGVIVLQRLLRHVAENWLPFDYPYYWPISIFEVRPPGAAGLVTAAVTLAAFFLLYRVLEAWRFPIAATVGLGSVLIIGTSLIHGVDVGMRAPVAGDARAGASVPYSQGGQEYWHDAKTVVSPVSFLANFNEIQPTLHSHAHTHPPGAVLTFYFLSKVFEDPAFISLVIMLFSLAVTAVSFYKLALTEASDATAKYLTLIATLLPAVQIYYLASIDAVITSVLIATLYLFCFGSKRWSVIAASVLLTSAFLLTYVSAFLLPVLLGFDLIVRKSAKRTVVVVFVLVGAHAGLYFLTGYDAWHAFREAARYENPNGPMPLVDTVNYAFTRLEDISEILLFFGPFLLVLFWRGMKRIEFTPLMTLTVLGIVTLVGMFLAGVWRTGETARACTFIYPFLLFPVARLLDTPGTTKNAGLQLASLVFFQTVAMQTIGTYHW